MKEKIIPHLNRKSQRRFCFLLLLILIVTSCFPEGTIKKAPSSEEGEVIMYLQPMPQEANNLRFTIDEMVATRDDGLEMPLSLLVHELKGAELSGIQKRLASGVLIPGQYTGVSIKIKKALIQTEEGEMALLVPEEPVAIEGQQFKVTRRQAVTMFVSFDPSGVITNDVRFTPRFSMAPAKAELINLMGYVTNSDANTISVFNKKTMQVVDTIATGAEPKGMVLDQQRRRAYVALFGDDAIEVIDLAKRKIIGRVRLDFRDEPIDLAITPDGKMLVSVNHGSNTVSIIDALSLFEITRITVGQGPTSAVINPSGLKAFIMNSGSNTLSIVDLTQKRLAVNLAVEGAPLRGDFNRQGDNLYIIIGNSPYLTIVDPSALVVSGRILIGMGAISIKADTKTDLILVGKKIGGDILVIDPFALMPIDAIPLAGNANFMAIDNDENRLFVALSDLKSLQKINLTSKKSIAEIEIADGPYAIVVMGER